MVVFIGGGERTMCINFELLGRWGAPGMRRRVRKDMVNLYTTVVFVLEVASVLG